MPKHKQHFLAASLGTGFVAGNAVWHWKCEGSGIPQTIAALRMPEGEARDRVLSLRLAVGKALLTCVGREGPTVQMRPCSTTCAG